VGFEYHWDDASQQFVHPAAIFVLTPTGKISRYLYGVSWEPRTLRLAFTEAGQGTVGKTTDQLLLYCFHYDSNQGRYVLAAANVMRLGGAATVLLVGVWLGSVWLRGARRKSREAGGARP
jgi:protein SCO1/2